MSVAGTERRLAAIMLADIAGYSTLMERDESRTFERVRALREGPVSLKVAEYGGRVIKTTGDGFLAVFTSATQALKCGIDLQRFNHADQAGSAEADRLHMRIGISLGDVIIDGNDISGDGVNVAARLESLAPLDGLCVSGNVRDQIRDDLGITLEDLGELNVKNLARPIRAFRINLTNSPVPKVVAPAFWSKPPWLARAAATAALLTLGGLIYWSQARPAPPPLSIVALPFTNASGDASQDYVADAITEEITVQLSRIRGSFVIGRNTAFTFKGKAVDLKAIAKELGVRYVLQGTAARNDDNVHVTVQLVDGSSGANLWADAIDTDRSRIGDIRREVVANLAVALRLQLLSAEGNRAEVLDARDAVELTMRAWAKFNQGATKGNLEAAQELLGKALAIQSDYEPALAGWAVVTARLIIVFGVPNSEKQLLQAERNALRAVELDPSDAVAHFALGQVRRIQSRVDDAIQANSQALELNPNYVDALAVQGLFLILTGQASLAVAPPERALLLSPLDPARYSPLYFICHAYMHMAKFREAVPWCEKSASLVPNVFNLSDLVAAYTQLGETEKAAAAKAQMLKIKPEFSITWYRNLRNSDNPVWKKEIEENIWAWLRKAGIPD